MEPAHGTRCVAKPPCTAGRVHETPTRLRPTQTPTDDRVRTRHSWSWSCGRAHTTPPRAPTDRQSAGWHRGLASGHRNLMRTTRASSAPADPCDDDAGICWLGVSLSFFEEHTNAVCAIARLRIQRQRLLRLPTITTLRGRRRGAAESATRKCPSWRCNAKRALHGSKAQRRPRSLSRNRAAETDRSPAIGQRS